MLTYVVLILPWLIQLHMIVKEWLLKAGEFCQSNPSFMLLPQVLLKISVLLLILNVGSNTNSNSLNNSKKVSCQRAINLNSEFIDSTYVWRVFAKCSFCVLFILRLSTNMVFMYFTKGLNQTLLNNPNFQAKHLFIFFYWITCNS